MRHFPRTLIAGLMAGAFCIGQAAAEELRPMLTITATGTASAAPDEARIIVGVEGTGYTAREAMAANTAQMQAVFEALSQFAIGDDHISTTGISLNPRYDHSQGAQPRIIGYHVSNQINVTVDEITLLGRVLDMIVAAGANNIRNVSFAIADTAELEAEARQAAAKLARKKAEDYAAALGTEIRGVVSISEAGGGHYPQPMPEMMMMRAADSAGPVPVAARDVDIQASLSVVFEISGTLE